MQIFAIITAFVLMTILYIPSEALSSETMKSNARVRGTGIAISPEGAELGVVAAGMHGGSTLYTTKVDVGVFHWCMNYDDSVNNPIEENSDYAPTSGKASEYCYSGSSGKDIRGTYASSPTDGRENIQIIMNLIASIKGLSLRNFPAATACSLLGEDWYLPSIEEMKVLFIRRQDIGGFQTELPYWTSTEFPNYGARVMSFDDYGMSRFESSHKSDALPVRCVAREKVSAR